MFGIILREMTLLMAQVHDMLMRINDGFELQLGDKDWHFIIMAIIAMVLFWMVHFVFKRLAKWSIKAITPVNTYQTYEWQEHADTHTCRTLNLKWRELTPRVKTTTTLQEAVNID